MGQCISTPVDIPAANSPISRPAVPIRRKGRKKPILQKHTWSSCKNDSIIPVKGSSEEILEPTKSTDSSESNHSKSKAIGKAKGVVVIPEATDYIDDDRKNRTEKGVEQILYDLNSPASTASTALLTPSFSVISHDGSVITPVTDMQSNREGKSTNTGKQTSGSLISSLSPNRWSRSNTPENLHPCPWQGLAEAPEQENLESSRSNAARSHNNLKSRQSSVYRKHRNSKKNAVVDEHPDSQLVDDPIQLITANFTPIKQTTLQSKVSVIREEEDPDAPSDEEYFHDKNIVRTIQRDMSSKNRVSGPLTPVKLRTQWKTSPSSIRLREPAVLLTGSSSISTSPLRNGQNGVSLQTEKHAAAKSVDESLMSNFQKLKLQVAVAEQQGKRNQKVSKIEDRLKDVQGYKELWGEFQSIQQQVSEVDSSVKQKNQLAENPVPVDVSAIDLVEYDLEDDDNEILAGRRRKRYSKSRRTSAQLPETDEGRNDFSSSFDLKNSTTWVFDFQAEGFEGHCVATDDDSSQASLSLLSEKSMEVQRRFFAQKRKDRKRKKRLQKQLETSSQIVDGTPASGSVRHKGLSDDNHSTTSDYGPANRLRRGRLPDLSAVQTLNETTSSLIPDMEMEFNSHGFIRVDADNCSLISDLADDQSYSASVASSNYTRDNNSVCSGNNDYRVNRRRQRNYSHRPVDVEKYVPSTGSVGESICSITERRKAIERRLQMLNKKQNELSAESAGPPSQLTRKFEEVVMPVPLSNNLSSAIDSQSPTRPEDPPGDVFLIERQDKRHCAANGLIDGHSYDGSFATAIAGTNLSLPMHEYCKYSHLKECKGSKGATDGVSSMSKEEFIRISHKHAFERGALWRLVDEGTFPTAGIVDDVEPNNNHEISQAILNDEISNVAPDNIESAEISGKLMQTFHHPSSRYEKPSSKCSLDLGDDTDDVFEEKKEDSQPIQTEFQSVENRKNTNWNGRGSHSCVRQLDEVDEEARKSLLLADKVAARVKDVLGKYRSSEPIGSDSCHTSTSKPIHDASSDNGDQPPRLLLVSDMFPTEL